jgi:hypothetical protein
MADLRLLGAVLPLAVAVLVALVELVALVLRRRRARRLLVAALDDPSPLERRAALRVLVNGGGVRRFVDVLTERVRFEEDPTVRDELASNRKKKLKNKEKREPKNKKRIK